MLQNPDYYAEEGVISKQLLSRLWTDVSHESQDFKHLFFDLDADVDGHQHS